MMTDDTQLLFWTGRSHFNRLALDVERHETAGVVRDSGDTTPVTHTFLLRHHRYPQMYVHPLVCSHTSGSRVCTSQDFSSIPENTLLVFRHIASGFVNFHNPRDADAAIMNINGHMIDGKTLQGKPNLNPKHT
jgi:hypothetical protein